MEQAISEERVKELLPEISLELGGLDSSDGSASFGFGQFKSLCSVTGPTEVRIRDERVDKASVDVGVVRPLRGGITPSHRTLSQTITSTLSPLMHLSSYPRSLIQISIQTIGMPPAPKSKFEWIQQQREGRKEDEDKEDELEGELGDEEELVIRRWPPVPSSSPTTPKPLIPHPNSNSKTYHSGVFQAPSTPSATEKATSINSAMLGLISSGFEMRGRVWVVAVAFVDDDLDGTKESGEGSSLSEEMQVDDEDGSRSKGKGRTKLKYCPTTSDELHSKSIHIFGFAFSSKRLSPPKFERGTTEKPDLPKSGKRKGEGKKADDEEGRDGTTEGETVLVESDGVFTEDEFFKALNFARQGCKEVDEIVRNKVEERFLKRYRDSQEEETMVADMMKKKKR